ncbi:MAG: hypothetical protein AAFR79_18605 [Pseudomonadota bacterium]
MAFATIETGGTFGARMAAQIIRPAAFLYLDWPTGEIFVSTHHTEVTADGRTWAGVGEFARLETDEFDDSGAQVVYTVGLSSLPQGAVDEAEQDDAIGQRAEIYLGLFDEGWANPVLRRIFVGTVGSVADFTHRRSENGWVTDASLEVTNGRNPRRAIQNHHSPETAENGDTAWRLLPNVARQQPWPTSR